MILTKLYQITKQFYSLSIKNKISSQNIGDYQYVIFLFLYNITTLVNPIYKFYDDNGLQTLPENYDFYQNKYKGTDELYLDVLLRYSFYLIVKLVYAKLPEIAGKSDEEIKILLGFGPTVEEIYSSYFAPDFSLFLNKFALSSWTSRKLIFEIYSCEACYTNPNSVTQGGPGPFPVDVNGTPQEYLDKYREPLKYNLLRIPTGVVKNEDGIPIIDPANPLSYKDQVYRGIQYGWMNGFWYNDDTKNTLPSLSYARITNEIDLKVQTRKMLKLYENLGDKEKIVSEFFSNNLPGQMPTNGLLSLITFFFNLKNKVSLYDEPAILFGCVATILDADLACWEIKRTFFTTRPVCAIRSFYNNELIKTWYPYQSSVITTANKFMPYQDLTFVTPPHAECGAGHSTVFPAVSSFLSKIFGSKFYDPNFSYEYDEIQWIYPGLVGQTRFTFGQYIVESKDSIIEPGLTPKNPVNLIYNTVQDWSDDCARSRFYGGIHWESTNNASKMLGNTISENTFDKLVKSGIIVKLNM